MLIALGMLIWAVLGFLLVGLLFWLRVFRFLPTNAKALLFMLAGPIVWLWFFGMGPR